MSLIDTIAPAPGKPRARGWIHFYSAIAAAILGAALVIAATTVSVGAALACGIYAVSIVALFAISATYHVHHWATAQARTRMKRLDHAMIFVFIAGTYTPVAVLALSPTSRQWVLGTVWAGALAGVAMTLLWPHSPRWLGVPIYVALGWVAVSVFPSWLTREGSCPSYCSSPAGCSTVWAKSCTPCRSQTRGRASSATTRCSTPQCRWLLCATS